MHLITNNNDLTVIGELNKCVDLTVNVDIATSNFTIYGYGNLSSFLKNIKSTRLLISDSSNNCKLMIGGTSDRVLRNQLSNSFYAKQFAEWLESYVNIKTATTPLPQSTLILKKNENSALKAFIGSCSLTTEGLGVYPASFFSLVQATDTPDEAKIISEWYDKMWESLSLENDKAKVIEELSKIYSEREPSLVYYKILSLLFDKDSATIDEDVVIKTATGIRETKIWQKLFKFQKDGVIGAIDKLEKFGGCIIADSVGLGKTFEALAIIKYYELRNNRVLVLAPKRLRDNWTLYKSNDRRNILSGDRLNYDVLNHTDLSRDNGKSGDIDLAQINWGNYDLVIIDESHNFRNKTSSRNGQETRYQRLMRQIIKEGVKTRVLMLSATPVNNRLADLKNQIAFITEGKDDALSTQGISSIEKTLSIAQTQFNRWLKSEPQDRKSNKLIEMLGFDYFKMLDLLTIARSRKHIEKYYGISETGKFPERLKPINYKPDVDTAGNFKSIREINNEIRRLTLAAYAPLRYVLPHKQSAYDEKYGTSVRGGQSFFRQIDREESLIHLIRINVLKRMESAVSSFALTLKRQLEDIDEILKKIETKQDSFEEIDIDDIEIDDPSFESLLVGSKIKILLKDLDLIRWKQDLTEDRARLSSLYSAASQVGASSDAKLQKLKEVISVKIRNNLNPGNNKIIVFTAFADTAKYLYEQLSVWAKENLGLESALVTGSGSNQCTIKKLPKDLTSVLTAFSPRSKERPADFAEEGEIDLIFATDCISEGQNLQDCDFLINYDIHWNPVRIIQRFGRIDRIGSPNSRIQLVNFWPNIQLEEYINLEQRVSGRMVLLDISATGEENIIEQDAGNQMNDLEYRRTQLLKLQDAVIDMEDLSAGISITDLTLTDFKIELSRYNKANVRKLDSLPLGTFSVVTTDDLGIPPGVIFCLKAEGELAEKLLEPGYPLAPYYIVYVADDQSIELPFTQTKTILDRLKRICVGKDVPDLRSYERYYRATKNCEDTTKSRLSLSSAISSVIGKREEKAVATLFTPGGTSALKGEFAGVNDFEVVSYLIILPV
jgi:SNF2 family DNA or RNA helicase